MDIAQNINGKRIRINKANKLEEYTCIICKNKVDVNQGDKRQFFSHAKGLGDDCELKFKLLLEQERKIKREAEQQLIMETKKLKSEKDKIDRENKLRLLKEEINNNVKEYLSAFTFTKKQQEAIDLFINQIESNFKTKKTIVISGKAGTGKSFLLSILANITEIYNKEYCVSAFTGKAVEVLRSKGIENTATIHSTMYKPEINSLGKIVKWVKNEALDFNIWFIDEFSMISKEMINHILEYRLPCIFTGDIKQLPPIMEESSCLSSKVDIELDEILRQAQGNPIIEKANFVRENNDIPKQILRIKNEQGFFGVLNKNHSAIDSLILKATQMISGTNVRRYELNNRYRKLSNMKDLIHINEKLVILKNNKSAGVYNGQILTIIDLGEIKKDLKGLTVQRVNTNMGEFYISIDCLINPEFDYKKALLLKVQGYIEPVIVDYGYCLTVHKLQGSQSETCLIFMDDMNWMKTKGDMFYRAVYTAITRSIKNCIVVY